MTTKTASVHARIQPMLKARAESVFDELGISTSEAIAMYFSQVALRNGLPFDARVPNKTTRKAVREARGGRAKKFSTVAGLMDDLNA